MTANTVNAQSAGAEALRGVERSVLKAVLGGLAATALTTALLWQQVGLELLAPWAAGVMLVYVLWLGLVYSISRAAAAGRPTAGRRAAWLFPFTGAVWGLSSASFLFPGAPAQQLILASALLLVCTAAMPALAYGRRDAAALLFPALGPFIIRLALEGGEASGALALVLSLAVGGLLALHGHLYRQRHEAERAAGEIHTLRNDLEASRDRMLQAQRIARFGDWEWDLESDRVLWSDEVFDIYDFEPGQLVTPSIILYTIHPADRWAYEQALNATLKGGLPFDVEFRIVRPDGSVRHLRDVAQPVFSVDGEPLRLRGVTSDITERVEAESSTRRAWRELKRVLENMQDTHFRIDADGRVSFASRSVYNLLGYPSESVVGKSFRELCSDDNDWPIFLASLEGGRGRVQDYELMLRRIDGRQVRVVLNAQEVVDSQGRRSAIGAVARDVSDLTRALEALDAEKERAIVTLQSIGDGVVTTDEQGRVHYLNPVAERLLGCDSSAAAGQHYLQLLSVVDESTGESLSDLVKLCLSGSTTVVHADEGRFVHNDGSEYHLKITAAPIRDRSSSVVGAVLVLHDITDVMGMAQQLSYQASHDTLTDLYNRQVFERRVEEAIRRAQSERAEHAVLYLDLDQFKVVNDTCGHQAGDELLQQVALMMQKTVRESDTLARLGGDEFGVLLLNCSIDHAVQLAEALRKRIRDFRFAWRDKVFDIGVSIGVVPVDAASANLAEVLSAADAACYVAKDEGRNRIHVYRLEDDAVARRHGEMEWVHRLSAAFDEERFVLYAQPIVHLGEDPVVSHYEVLVRLTDRAGGIVPPMAFIPAAERYNLMPAVDRWVVRAAFTMMRRAQGELAFPPVNCAINISGQSLCDDHFLDFVIDLFDETDIPPEAISFEITETAAIANLASATRFIQIMRDLGCSFALDDFGSGLSSFGYLKTLAVDYLKIDGCFVKNVARDKVDRSMVEAINQIGHVLGLKTIAEFVDDDAAVEVLKGMGVDYVQGHGVGRPSRFDEVLSAAMPQIEAVAANK